jgi:N-acetylmuramoyl-L-alanine amidase
MRVTVINLHKHRFAFSAVKFISVILIGVLLGGIFINIYGGSDTYVYAMQKANDENVIVIDAGHGGEDPGAIGKSGVYEKDLNLEIAFVIGELLSERGFAVVYTRTEDKLMYNSDENVKGIRKISDLKNRCKIAAEYPSAIFVSVHMNSYGNEKYSGLQVYYSKKNENSSILADCIQNGVRNDLQPGNNRRIKPGNDMYLMENIDNAAVLIECGFLTNFEECKKLSEKEYQKQLSLAIVCGIIDYKEKVLKQKDI